MLHERPIGWEPVSRAQGGVGAACDCWRPAEIAATRGNRCAPTERPAWHIVQDVIDLRWATTRGIDAPSRLEHRRRKPASMQVQRSSLRMKTQGIRKPDGRATSPRPLSTKP